MRMHPILRWSLNSSTDVMEFSSNTWTFFLALLLPLLLMLSSYLRLKSLFIHTILSQRSFDFPFLCPLFFTLVLLHSLTIWISSLSHVFLVYIVRHYYLNFAITSLCYYCFALWSPNLCFESPARSLFWYFDLWWGSLSVDGMVIFHGLWTVGNLLMQIPMYQNLRVPWFLMSAHLKKL